MSGAVQKCQLDGCTRATSTKCFCCQKNVCTKHFMEHIEAVKRQIDPLVNDINEMVESIRALTINKITKPSFAQLQQWRTDMHRQIDEIFLTKTKEMEDLIATNKEKFAEHQKQQLESVLKMQDQVRQLVEDEDVTSAQIQLLENQIATVHKSLVSFEKDFLSVSTRELVQGLVTVSSNLNKPTPPPPMFPQPHKPEQAAIIAARNRRRAQCEKANRVFSPTPPVQAPIVSPFSPFGGGFQNNAAMLLPNPMYDRFGGTPINAANVGNSPKPSLAPVYGSNQPGLHNRARFSFGANQQK